MGREGLDDDDDDDDDDGIICLSQNFPEPIRCAFCNSTLDHLTIQEREEHCETHLAIQEHNPSPAPILRTKSHKFPFKSTAKTVPAAQNVFWHPLLADDPPSNFSPGLIPVLKWAFTKLCAKNITTRAVLCQEGACHIATEFFDLGWGCGYRNFLMACTALISQESQPMYFPLLDRPNGTISKVATSSSNATQSSCGPGVRGLQKWIQNAWEEGYDEDGAKELNHTLIDTRKWVGTGDIYVAFTYCGIPARLVDFPKSKAKPPKPKSQRNALPSEDDSATALIRWIMDYFDHKSEDANGMPIVGSRRPLTTENALDRLRGATPVVISDRMPIILQHKGHSRTIIGYEMTKTGTVNLLIFDPALKPPPNVRRAAFALHKSKSMHLPSGSDYPSRTSRMMDSIRKLSPTKMIPRKRSPGLSSPGGQHGDDRENKRFRGRSDILKERESALLDEDGVVLLNDDVLVEGKGEAPSHAKDHSSGWKEDIDPQKTANFFRINHKKLSKNDQYQILYFPLTAPLTESEQNARRIVTSMCVMPDVDVDGFLG